MASKFSKQHYIAIAEVLRNRYATSRERLDAAVKNGEDVVTYANAESWHGQVIETTEDLLEMFERDNPRFSRQHFIAVVEGRKALNSRP